MSLAKYLIGKYTHFIFSTEMLCRFNLLSIEKTYLLNEKLQCSLCFRDFYILSNSTCTIIVHNFYIMEKRVLKILRNLALVSQLLNSQMGILTQLV